MSLFPHSSELPTMPVDALQDLASRCRQEILQTVSRQGGHLASNLGTVELTIALHAVFDFIQQDALYFDVGHQCYVHKLLTGRQESFQRLRQDDGCSGFPSPEESPADPVYAGHAGVALSQALGDAQARQLTGAPGKTVAVIGDGAMCCGIPWEGMNNIRSGGKRLVVILNDNQMSIAPASGSLRRCLNRIISGRFYNRVRQAVKNRLSPNHDGAFSTLVRRLDDSIKGMLLPPGALFQELGFRYFGPIDGHDISEMLHFFKMAKDCTSPVLLHLVTRKGNGYLPAEENPSTFHGVAPFDLPSGKALQPSNDLTYSQCFGQCMVDLAKEHPELTAISAAMIDGTGLDEFAKLYPERIFDTGIAEEHAVAFAAGLAKRGLRPVVAIYSTFLQRALDNIYHDVCLNKLPVIFAVDRAGVVNDGPTHHGIYDLGFLREMPGLQILAPANAGEFAAMMEYAWQAASPIVIRYPRGKCPAATENPPPPVITGKARIVLEAENPAGVIWSCGGMLSTALECAKLLQENSPQAQFTVVDARFIKPFHRELARSFRHLPQFTMEDHCLGGGLGAALAQALEGIPHAGCRSFGWSDDTIIPHGTPAILQQKHALLPQDLANAIRQQLKL